MSRFLRSPAARTSTAPVVSTPVTTATAPQAAVRRPLAQQSFTSPSTAAGFVEAAEPNLVQRLGFIVVCVYILSGLANDWTMRFFHDKSYLTLIAGAVLPLICLASGHFFRGLRLPMGRWWVAFLVWLILTIPFSSWRTDSLGIVKNFAIKSYVLLFYLPAVAVSLKQVRRLFLVQAFGAVIVIVSCAMFGDASTGRLSIPDSIFFDNANDLALQLNIFAAFTLLLMFSRNWIVRLSGAALLMISVVYLLKTGSRANSLAAGVCLIVGFMLSRNKAKIVAAIAVLVLVAAVAVGSQQWSRVSHIWMLSDAPVDSQNAGAAMSEEQRMDMLKKSLVLTFTHPLFGVGPGQFADVVWREGKMKGIVVPSLQTHNTYTQVSSEAGVPAFLFYTLTLFLAIRTQYRIYRDCRGRPELSDAGVLAYCLLLATLAYAVGSCFHSVAYTRHLATLGGITISLALAVERIGKAPVAARR